MILTTVYIFIIGLAFGSFLNVLADRLSNEEGIGGRSHCDHCGHTLAAKDLIPLISFILLHGKCRYCGKRLSWYYPFSEVLTGLAFVFVYIYLDNIFRLSPLYIIMYLGVVSSLIGILFADLKYYIIPDELVVSLTGFSLGLSFLQNRLPVSIVEGIAVASILLFLYLITRGRGIGFGDVKYSFGMGVLLGLKDGLIGLYIAFIAGAIVSLILIAGRKKGLKSTIPFGPFLILGTVVTLFFSSFFTLPF